jgi:hypothetical protein
MTLPPNRVLALIFPGLTAIALVVIYGIWLVADELARSVYGPWLLLELALMAGLIILGPGLFRRYHRKLYLVLTGLYVAALIIGWNVDWSPAKPFYRFYSGVQVGMTIPEVQQRLDQAFPPNGWYPKPPTESASLGPDGKTRQFFRLEPPLSAEVIMVEFEQGRVTKTEYSPD